MTIFLNNRFIFSRQLYISKFEEVAQNYRNNLSNKFGLLKKVIPPTDSISLKKINLSNNISERKKEFINIVLPIIVDQNRKIIVTSPKTHRFKKLFKSK